MKNYILSLMFVLFGLSSEAQTCPVQLSLKGKIINNINLGADCGYLKLASVIEFEIIEFSDLTYKEKSIAIIFRCPEMYGENFFELNQVYNINVEREIENGTRSDFNYQIQNTEVLEKYKPVMNYWALNGNVKKIR